jgi:CHAT domain-containing protein
MAKSLNDKGKSIWLTNNATETNVKTIDLSVYKVLAFATHGVMAGEVKGIGEPGLILTPPKEATSQDDGYLSASEVAQLKLNAELVILSACNTAASDGKVGSEGLTGLAKSFFYAGARSLFVSHWPVASETTVQLTTDMLKEYAQNPNSGLAAAHRKSILKLMSKPSNIEYSHPLFWSPFQIIGEGF